jgi:hypothetical protein
VEALVTTNDNRSLVLYGHPGSSYIVDTATNLVSPIFWQVQWQGPLTNLSQRINNLSVTNEINFYRARE